MIAESLQLFVWLWIRGARTQYDGFKDDYIKQSENQF